MFMYYTYKPSFINILYYTKTVLKFVEQFKTSKRKQSSEATSFKICKDTEPILSE